MLVKRENLRSECNEVSRDNLLEKGKNLGSECNEVYVRI